MKIKKVLSIVLSGTILLSMGGMKSDALKRWDLNYGPNRVKTAEYVANSLNERINSTDVAPLKGSVPTVLVNRYNYQDGLSAYNLAEKYNARVLLIKKSYANIGLMKDYYHSKQVYLLGGYDEITPELEEKLKKEMPDTSIIRIKGANGYERNITTLKMTGFKNIGVADGRNFADALSASGMLHTRGCGLMIVNGEKDYQVPDGMKVVYTIGGKNSVSKDLGKRLAGKNRYETAKLVAREAKGYTNAVIVDGRNWPDSICGINFVRPHNAIVLPISPRRDNSDYFEFLRKVDFAYFIGGANSIPRVTIDEIVLPLL